MTDESDEKKYLAMLVNDNDQMWMEFKEVIKAYTHDEFCDIANEYNDNVQELTERVNESDGDDTELNYELLTKFGAMCSINKAWQELCEVKMMEEEMNSE